MLNIVLFQPEIPENTGNIIRTCVAFNAKLHLIRPYGFIFSKNSKLIRTSTNHFDEVQIFEYDNYEDFCTKNKNINIYFVTRYGKMLPSNVSFKQNKKNELFLIFGKESSGIDKKILEENKTKTIRIPMTNKMQSINLANTVAILAYKFCSDNNFIGLEKDEVINPLL